LTIALPPLRGRAYVQDAAYEREQEEGTMSVARVTEITSSSKKSFDDAVKEGIKRAAKTLKNVEGAWVQDQTVVVKDGKVAEYRVNMKVTFILAD
jgi:flavin-binding protein dodecin